MQTTINRTIIVIIVGQAIDEVKGQAGWLKFSEGS